MTIDLPTPDQLRERGGLKWTYHSQEVLAAWVAEMDFGLAPSIAVALQDAVARGDTGYPAPGLVDATREAAVDFWSVRFDWTVDKGRVNPVPDVIEGIARAITHLTKPGSPVVVHTPVYFPFFDVIDTVGRKIVEVPSPIGSDGAYRIDLDGVEQALRDGAGSILLCNPWNPTGRALTATEIDAVIDLASTYDARLIVDEIHSALVYPGNTHVIAATRDPANVITVTSASKAWNLPGLKGAQVVLTNDDDQEKWSRIYDSVGKSGIGSFGLIANAAAYNGGRSWLDLAMDQLAANRELLGELVAAHLPDLGLTLPQATYLAWLDFAPLGIERPGEFFLAEAGVAMTEGALFRGDGAGKARLNFATTPAILTEVVERIATAL